MNTKNPKNIRKNQKNLLPFYAEDMQHLIDKLRVINSKKPETELTKLISVIYQKFHSAGMQVEIDFSVQRIKLQYKNTKEKQEEVCDKLALAMLHFYNEIFNFLPMHYPKLLINSLLKEQRSIIDTNSDFEDLKAIENIYSPLTVPVVVKLSKLLNLSREGVFRLFSDVPDDLDLAKLNSISNDFRDNSLYPTHHFTFRKQWCDYMQLMYDAGVLNNRKDLFIENNENKLQFNPIAREENLPPKYKELHQTLKYYSPYITARFWYALGKNLGLFDVKNVLKMIKYKSTSSKEIKVITTLLNSQV